MRILLIAILSASIILAGCSNVRTYTFKKERVDQRIAGNRGYLIGTPPPAPVEREVPKRTLIGIDIEVPLLPGEKGYKPTSYKPLPIRKEDITMERKAAAGSEGVVSEEDVEPYTSPDALEAPSYEPVAEEAPAPSAEKTIAGEGEEWIK